MAICVTLRQCGLEEQPDDAGRDIETHGGEAIRLAVQLWQKPIEGRRLGCCRSYYDGRYHSLRFFGGLRERVLERDRFRCQGCGLSSPLVVHHRAPNNPPESLITLCIRCHMRIYHCSGFRYRFPRILLLLWRELHRREPPQLQLALEGAAKAPKDSFNRQQAHDHEIALAATAKE